VESDASFWSGLSGVLSALGAVLTGLAALVGALCAAGLIRTRRAGKRAGTPSTPAHEVLRLRDVPGEVSGERMDVMLVERDFHDRDRHPSGKGIAHRYETRARGDTLVIADMATRLMWERDGSALPVSAEAARTYVAKLNARCHAGFADWRLPTAEEASSLVEPHMGSSLQISDMFGAGQRFLWTSDRAPDGRVWVLYACAGHLSCEAQQFNAWVKAVRSAGSEGWAAERPTPARREGAEALTPEAAL